MNEDLMQSPEHFELLRGALDHIAKTARASRSQTRRLRWIEVRAQKALQGEVYRAEEVDLPKSAGPSTPERLARRINKLRAEKRILLEELRSVYEWATTERAPLREQEIQSICDAISKVTAAPEPGHA